MERGALAAAVDAFSEHVQRSGPLSCIERVVFEEESTLVFHVRFPDGSGALSRLRIIYAEPEAYPNSPAIISCEDNNDLHSDKLSALSEQFQDKAPLTDVIIKVLEMYGLSMDLPGSCTKAKPRAAAASDDDGGDDNDDWDASDDGASYEYEGMSIDKADDGGDEDDAENQDDDDDDDDESDDDEDGIEEREMTIACGKRQGRWKRFEDERAELQKGASGSNRVESAVLSFEQGDVMKKQIFHPQEAFLMLSRELLDMHRRCSFDLFVDTVGDDVYSWSVELGGFKPSSQLHKDMQLIQRRFQYSTVKLHITFKRGLHPFYPPSVEVVRPHFTGPVLGAVASHPMLRLDNWDPLRSIADLIGLIKSFLEAVASVDMDHVMNDISSFSQSCYRPVEQHLARLEALTGISPLCQETGAEIYKARDTCFRELEKKQVPGEGSTPTKAEAGAAGAVAEATSSKRMRSCADALLPPVHPTLGAICSKAGTLLPPALPKLGATGAKADALPKPGAPGAKAAAWGLAAGKNAAGDNKTYWARGTGYGHGGISSSTDPVWDSRASEAAQKARDDELRHVLEVLTTAITEELGSRNPDSIEPMDTSDQGGPSKPRQPPCNPETCIDMLKSSCLVPFLVQELRPTNFTDMCSRASFYVTLVGLVHSLCQPGAAALLAMEHPSGGAAAGGKSVATIMRSLQSSVQQYAKLTRPVYEAEMKTGVVPGSTPVAGSSTASRAVQEGLQELCSCMALADLLLNCCSKVEVMPETTAAPTPALAVVSAVASPPRRVTRSRSNMSGAAIAAESSSVAAIAAALVPEDYCAAMRELQVEFVCLKDAKHEHYSRAVSEPSQPKPRMLRLAKEMSGLKDLLPLNESSTVLVRVDEEKVMLWRALITGPEDTPYSGGCFIFDFYFPTTYPAAPPTVTLKTTGGGSVRFNPNLYNTGKVCLSLLGTWGGGKGEGWTADVSSALQVLLSIQSLILVPTPYFNEPGYERTMGTPAGDNASRDYNKTIREATMKFAMIDLIRHPPAEFEKAIKTHFGLRKQHILKTTDTWIEEAAAWNPGHATRLQALKEQLQPLLEEL